MTPPDDITDATVVVPGYEGFERIGQGGFSSVYRARQSSLGREVAVKVLHADFSSAGDRRTFERECRALGLLSRHPNIVTVYSDAFTGEGRPCIVMELYHGTLRERLAQSGPLPVADALVLGVKVAGALHAAHEGGVLHRDIKPHNVFVSDYGEPALGDFGISTIDDERSVSGEQGGLSIAYAAPEVLEDSTTSVRSDVYALAATLYHLIEGRAPFAAGQLRATVKRILTEPAPALTRADVPDYLDQVLRRGLEKRPADRYASAEELAEALRDVQGRMGLDRTEMPLRRPSSAPPDLPSGARLGGDVAPAGGPRPSEDTVARPRRDEPAPPPVFAADDDDDGEPSRARRMVAVALAVAVVLGIVIVAWSQRDDSGDASRATTPLTVADDDPPGGNFFAILDVPGNVAVAGVGGSIEITFDPVDGAVGYEARPVSGSGVESGDASPITIDRALDASPCWTVRAVGEGGRVSRDSEPACG